MIEEEFIFPLSDEDKELFAKMRLSYASEAEKTFFSTLEYKEQYESAYANECLVFEKENEDNLYLLRRFYDTYLVGYCYAEGQARKYECETLADALLMRLDECVGFPQKITLGEWLRKCDYSLVNYNRNHDLD